MAETLHIYLHDSWRAAAEAGEVNLFNRMARALPGWTLRFHPDTPGERAKAARRGYGLFHMQEPTAPNILCLRRAYEYPFWRIERTNERWNFDVARASFDPGAIPKAEARQFWSRWRDWLFPAASPRRDGFVFVPLQGHLTRHRSFQAMSPLDMIEATLARTRRPVVATLHPKEAYSAEDIARIEDIARRQPRFSLSPRPSTALLEGCDLVVTQNSSLAFRGYFLKKRAVLFAGSDFHHIAGSVPRLGLDGAFAAAKGPPPDFAAYVRWFWGTHSLNLGAPDAEERIARRLGEHGWPVG